MNAIQWTEKERYLSVYEDIDLAWDQMHDTERKIKEKALEILEQAVFPSSKDESWKYTSLKQVLSSEPMILAPSSVSATTLEMVQKWLPDPENAFCIFLYNGNWIESLSLLPESGIDILNGKDIYNEGSSFLEVYSRKTSVDQPFISAENQLFSSPISIKIQKNKIFSKPVEVVAVWDAQGPSRAHASLFIEVESGADIQWKYKQHCFKEGAFFATLSETILLRENARMTHLKWQEHAAELNMIHLTEAVLEDNSYFSNHTISLGNLWLKNILAYRIGKGCDARMYGLSLLHEKAHVDHLTIMDHQKPHSESTELYKGVYSDESKGIFNGRIYVQEDAQKTNAFQSNRTVLLSDRAEVKSKPQLEIWADDVKCSHGATIGKLDEQAIFYLRSRGIPNEVAKKLLLEAFANEVLESYPSDKDREKMQTSVSEVLSWL